MTDDYVLTASSVSLMNWTCLVYGGPMFGIMIWWVVDARKWFKGPKVNIQHQMLGREGNDGGQGESSGSGGSSETSLNKNTRSTDDAKAAEMA